jgi:hypothetical protein
MSEIFVTLDMTETWRPLPEYRLIGAVQGTQTLGPALQRAWQSDKGRIEWRTVSAVMLSVGDFHAAVASVE